jgi:lambda family phage tail tape measure protein
MAMDMSVGMRIAASVTGGSSVDDLRKSVDNLNKSAGGIEGAFKTAGTAIKAFIGIEAVRQVATYAMSLMNTADALGEMSERTGVAVETLNKFYESAKLGGTSIEAVAGGLRKLSVNLTAAQNGSESAARGFQALRLDPKSFNSVEEAMAAISDRFAKMEDGANKVAIANALLGKSGSELIIFLNQGSAAMAKFSGVFSPQFIGMSANFNDQLDIMSFNFQRVAASTLEKFLPTINQVFQSFNALTATKSDFIGFFDLLAEGFRQIAALAQIVVASIRQMLELVSTAYDASAFALSGQLDAAGARLKEGFKNILDIGKQGIDQFKALQKDSLIFGSGSAQEIMARQRDAAGANANQRRSGFNPDMSFLGAEAKTIKTLDEQEQDRIRKFIVNQERANEKRRDELKAVEMTTVEYQKMVAVKEIEARSAELAVGMMDKNKEELAKQTELLKEQTAAMIELEYTTKRTFEYGAKSAIKSYADELGNVAKQTQEAMTKAFKGMEDALVNFVMTGKMDFKSLANSIIQDLARIAIRTMVLKPILGSMGMTAFANGGIMTGAGEMPLKKYATGGIATTPQLALFGEGSQPEAFVPLPDGRTIPVTMSGGGSTNNVTVNVAVDGSNASTQASGTEAAQLGNAISKAVQNELIKQQRPGGLLYAR